MYPGDLGWAPSEGSHCQCPQRHSEGSGAGADWFSALQVAVQSHRLERRECVENRTHSQSPLQRLIFEKLQS